MTTIFDPDKHLTEPDRNRLKEAAKKQGLAPGELIETLVKRALFAPPVGEPTKRQKGH